MSISTILTHLFSHFQLHPRNAFPCSAVAISIDRSVKQQQLPFRGNDENIKYFVSNRYLVDASIRLQHSILFDEVDFKGVDQVKNKISLATKIKIIQVEEVEASMQLGVEVKILFLGLPSLALRMFVTLTYVQKTMIRPLMLDILQITTDMCAAGCKVYATISGAYDSSQIASQILVIDPNNQSRTR